jgi:hypothetical protein
VNVVLDTAFFVEAEGYALGVSGFLADYNPIYRFELRNAPPLAIQADGLGEAAYWGRLCACCRAEITREVTVGRTIVDLLRAAHAEHRRVDVSTDVLPLDDMRALYFGSTLPGPGRDG